MKSVKFIFVALLSMVALASCNKEESASLVLERDALYFSSWNDSNWQTISYVATNAVSVDVGSISEGWNAIVNASSRMIMVQAVGSTDDSVSNDDLLKEGSMVINGLNRENKATSYHVNLYICEEVSLDESGAANCYVITQPSTSYTFDVMHRPDGSELATKSVALLWQSNYGVVKSINLVDGKAALYVASSADDATRVENTNAVVAAYNSSKEIIWSWHLWITNDNPLTNVDTYSNGKTFMRQNLGAFTNSNGSVDEMKIYDSYGMYYQWGRKDPFPRPYFFDAAGAEDEGRYNIEGGLLTEKFEERTASNGTIAYTIKNPMTFITTAGDLEEGAVGNCNWLASEDNTLWSDSEKSLYDPCPAGWRVPTASDLEVLKADPNEGAELDATLRKQYGWFLSDGTSTYFWSACGRRRYNDGKVENMNYKEGVYPSQPQPWEGYYWSSSTAEDGKAVSLYFDLTTTRLVNKFYNQHPDRRANGFQVRCVKE